jgi:hypothetical protein
LEHKHTTKATYKKETRKRKKEGNKNTTFGNHAIPPNSGISNHESLSKEEKEVYDKLSNKLEKRFFKSHRHYQLSAIAVSVELDS